MGHVEYIEKLIEDMKEDFANYPAKEFNNPEQITSFREGVIFGMKYIVASLKNPIDWGDKE